MRDGAIDLVNSTSLGCGLSQQNPSKANQFNTPLPLSPALIRCFYDCSVLQIENNGEGGTVEHVLCMFDSLMNWLGFACLTLPAIVMVAMYSRVNPLLDRSSSDQLSR